jgi:hypothetical protein
MRPRRCETLRDRANDLSLGLAGGFENRRAPRNNNAFLEDYEACVSRGEWYTQPNPREFAEQGFSTSAASGPHDGYENRYTSREDALAGHEAALNLARENIR